MKLIKYSTGMFLKEGYIKTWFIKKGNKFCRVKREKALFSKQGYLKVRVKTYNKLLLGNNKPYERFDIIPIRNIK